MPATAGILVRISDDRTGDALGVDRQEQDCRALAKRRGWDVGKVYRENDTSAFQRRKVRLPDGTTALRVLRPAFRELLADIAAGTVTALVAYDLDRVARDPRDLEDLIDAVEATHLPTAAVTGDIDLSTDNGVFMARMMVNVANKSSRDTSRRVRRATLALAEAGGVGGGPRPFGYQPDRVTLDLVEAEAVRWAHQQVIVGRSLRSIGVELAGRFPDRRWDVDGVRRILTNPRNAGLRQHQGVVIGPAKWQPIVTPETRDRTITVLDDRAHPNRHVGGPRRYLLTGLLMCGRCGMTLYPRRNADRQRFGCLPTTSGGCGGSIVVYEPAEAAVLGLVLDRLAALDVTPDDTDPAAPLRAEIGRLEEAQRLLGEQLTDPDEVLMARAANKRYAREIATVRDRLLTLTRQERISDPQQVLADWPAFDPDQRRAVVDQLVERIIVKPHRGGPRFDPTRLTMVWR